MKLNKINLSDFPNWKSYYFSYQKKLAESYYIPLLKKTGVRIGINTKILDVGCGNGGFISAFSDLSDYCNGLEIKKFDWYENKNLKIFVGDITSKEVRDKLFDNYDVIILRDVIEHIFSSEKVDFLKSIVLYMNENSKLLVTFPPFYSSFGLHQQTILKSPLRLVPFLGWLPKIVLKYLLKTFNQKDKWTDIREIKESGMTIGGFENLIEQCGLKICFKENYLIRPSHQIRYGLKMKKLNWFKVPLLKEIIISGCTYIIKKRHE